MINIIILLTQTVDPKSLQRRATSRSVLYVLTVNRLNDRVRKVHLYLLIHFLLIHEAFSH